MAWFAKNNNFGGINCVTGDTAPAGYIPVTDAQAAAIKAAAPGTTIDANGNLVAPAVLLIPVSQQPTVVQKRQVRETITKGFSSSALGTANTYPSSETDQRNLALAGLTAASHGMGLPLWCMDASGNWAFTPHTAAQVLQVVADFNAFRVSQSASLPA